MDDKMKMEFLDDKINALVTKAMNYEYTLSPHEDIEEGEREDRKEDLDQAKRKLKRYIIEYLMNQKVEL